VGARATSPGAQPIEIPGTSVSAPATCRDRRRKTRRESSGIAIRARIVAAGMRRRCGVVVVAYRSRAHAGSRRSALARPRHTREDRLRRGLRHADRVGPFPVARFAGPRRDTATVHRCRGHRALPRGTVASAVAGPRERVSDRWAAVARVLRSDSASCAFFGAPQRRRRFGATGRAAARRQRQHRRHAEPLHTPPPLHSLRIFSR